MKVLIFLFAWLFVSGTQAKVTFDHVRVVAPKVNKITKKKVRKSFHGKKIVTEQTELISAKPTENNKVIQEYIQNILDRMNKELWPKLVKDKKSLLFRFQIQESGFFDVLNIKTDSLKNYQAVESWLQAVDQFPALTKDSGQKELQLEFSIVLK